MSDYSAVRKALESGVDPAMLCATCPWDRLCISPPIMTREEVADEIKKAGKPDPGDLGEPTGRDSNLVASLITTMVFAGRDQQTDCCPVFLVRLRSADGRELADELKASMQQWTAKPQ